MENLSKHIFVIFLILSTYYLYNYLFTWNNIVKNFSENKISTSTIKEDSKNISVDNFNELIKDSNIDDINIRKVDYNEIEELVDYDLKREQLNLSHKDEKKLDNKLNDFQVFWIQSVHPSAYIWSKNNKLILKTWIINNDWKLDNIVDLYDLWYFTQWVNYKVEYYYDEPPKICYDRRTPYIWTKLENVFSDTSLFASIWKDDFINSINKEIWYTWANSRWWNLCEEGNWWTVYILNSDWIVSIISSIDKYFELLEDELNEGKDTNILNNSKENTIVIEENKSSELSTDIKIDPYCWLWRLELYWGYPNCKWLKWWNLITLHEYIDVWSCKWHYNVYQNVLDWKIISVYITDWHCLNSNDWWFEVSWVKDIIAECIKWGWTWNYKSFYTTVASAAWKKIWTACEVVLN